MTEDPPEQPSGGRLRPISAAALTGWAAAGLVGGWLLHPLSERVMDVPPLVTWSQPAALWFVVVVLGTTAWSTWRTVQVRREYLEPHRAVNRLVLARASALVGALLAGGYLGYAVSWLGVDAGLAEERIWRSLAAALAGVGITITAVLLERACRVPSDDEDA